MKPADRLSDNPRCRRAQHVEHSRAMFPGRRNFGENFRLDLVKKRSRQHASCSVAQHSGGHRFFDSRICGK
jgi:hypothetical protein